MCVPCAKEVINNGFTQAAATAELLRKLTLREPEEVSQEQDDQLYELACVELDAIQRVKTSALEMARMQKAPPRWLALIESL